MVRPDLGGSRAITSVAQDSRIRVEMLGGFRVVVDGREVEPGAWPSRRSVELVQLLSLADRHRLTRDEVIEALWPHLDVDAGGANLRKAAHHARQALGKPDAVVLGGGQVALLPEGAVETDVEEFDAAGTVEAYAGELLPEAPYEDWVQGPREHLRARYAELLRSAGEWERLVEIEPTDEPAYRELMRREMATGSRPAAIRWYGRLRTALLRDLGILPSAETQALYDECVADLGADEPELVGRQLELAEATAQLRAEPDAEGGALVIRGPAGIGKSAMCREVTRLAEAESWTAVSVTASEDAAPYSPVAALVEQIVGRDRQLLGELGERARTVLAELTPAVTSDEALGRPLNRHEVIGAVRRLLVAAAGETGIALIIDDAHLADEATVELLPHVGSAGGVRILPVLAYRPERASDALTRAVARIGRRGNVTELDLEPLDRDDAAALVAAASPTPRAPDVVDRIIELARGNPFLTLEAARSPLAGVPSLVSTGRDAIVARLVDLDEDETAMLGRLALAGDDLDPASVVAMTGSSEGDAFALLDRALGDGVLVVANTRYRFRHELVRQALIERIAPHERVAVHRDMAERLAEAGAPAGLVARQWVEAQSPDDAREWLLAAAQEAVNLGAYRDALALLDELLSAAPEHVNALTMRAEAMDALGDSGAPAAYARAAEVVGDPVAQDLKSKQALATIKLGDPEGALEALQGLEPTSLDGRIAHALAHCGCAVLGYATPEIGAAKAAEARRLAIEAGDADAVVIASWAHAGAAHANGRLRESVRTDLEDTSAMPKLATSVFDGQLCMTQRFLYGARPYSDVIAFADSLATEAERLGAARGRAFAVTIRGEARLLAGDLDGADKDLSRGAELHREIAAATGEAFSLQRRAEVAMYRGDRDEARAILDESLAIARESDVGFHLLDRIYGTRIALAGDPDSALAALEEAEEAVRGPIETCPGCRITLAVPAAIAAARSGDAELADRWQEQSEWLADVVMRLPAWYAAVEEIKGHRAQTDGDPVAAAEHFRAASAGYGESGQPLDQERCAELAAGV